MLEPPRAAAPPHDLLEPRRVIELAKASGRFGPTLADRAGRSAHGWRCAKALKPASLRPLALRRKSALEHASRFSLKLRRALCHCSPLARGENLIKQGLELMDAKGFGQQRVRAQIAGEIGGVASVHDAGA